ncbi:MAG: FAD/NAD(P)-binding oxidoreductase [Spirochaetales bacterium]|nr:FAD/NAD(P)-binding oxidoreductase [Spirochaetales bacterium]
MNKALPIVLVGSGTAAAHAVKAIRKNGYQGGIHLFSDNIQPPFNPMLITYYLGGKIPLNECYLYGNNFDFYESHQVTLHNNTSVAQLNVKESAVITASGQKVNYQTCLIASGASALVPPVPGAKSQRIFTIRTMEDAIRLREIYLDRPKKVVLVGASMVGIKLVEVFQQVGSEVYLVDLAPHVFAQAAHPECARIMEEDLQRRGIKLILNSKVAGVDESKEKLKVSFAGDVPDLEADLLVFCIGVKPNLDYIQPGELAIDRGILVDDRMCTSVANVYAAGDVAQGLNLLNQKKDVVALWANACQQGLVAGANMAGVYAVYPVSIPQNITHFFDVYFVSIGNIYQYDEIEKKHNNHTYSFYFKSKGKIVGVNFLSIGNYGLNNSEVIVRSENLKTLNKD